MYELCPQTDPHLAAFINDYVEGSLGKIERRVFREYLSANKSISDFVDRSAEGKCKLNKAIQVKAADDFEEKLAARIQAEKQKCTPDSSSNLASAS